MLAHELAHVVQQQEATSIFPAISPARDASELAAERLASGVSERPSVVAAVPAIQRQPATAGAPAPPGPTRTAPQIADLNEGVTQALAEKESRRRAVESGMPTSAGVRASYASQVQATAVWTIGALLALDDTHLATFGLTRAELRAANRRKAAAHEIWDSVMASASAMTGAAFVAANGPRIAAAGLLQPDIDRMFLFRDLRNDLENRLTTDVPKRTAALQAMAPHAVWSLATAHERRNADAHNVGSMTTARRDALAAVIARREAVAAVAAAGPATALGFSVATINRYRPPPPSKVMNWAEDRAAWERVAVGREPPGGTGTVGTRVEAAATSDGGLRLGRLEIARINEQFLRAHPNATDDEVCDNAAKHHNSKNPMKAEVRGFFHAFQAQRAATPASAPAPTPSPASPAPAPIFHFHRG